MQGVNNITEVSDALSSIMHMYLDQRNIITINEEIEYLINYLEIQKYKYHDNFSYNINIEENCKKYKVLKLIIQPLVENSLIHGIQSINKKGIILVKVYEENGLLKIIVQDNGIGIDENKIAEIYNNQIDSKSIGINNIRSRIKLFYGSEYDIKYNSQPYIQTLAELTLPIILGDNDNE
jgi:two-component system sensor histidine kinase YesM